MAPPEKTQVSTSMSTTTLAFPPQAEEALRSQPARASTVAVTDVALTRLPSLDGWRALSIVLVLGAHTALTTGFPQRLEGPFHHLFDGHMGVRFFFVVSGLLITWLMLGEERKTQKVNLRNFYARRALRILPVYFAFLIVAGIIQYFTTCDHDFTTWIANLTFTRDFFPGGNTLSNHFWSLAVEEQFYLLWPFLFVWLAPAVRTRIMPFLVVAAILVAFLNRCLWKFLLSDAPLWGNLFHEWSFFNNVDSLAIGCMAAIWLAADQRGLRSLLTSRPRRVVLVGVLMLMEPYVMHWLTDRAWMPPVLKSVGWAFWCGLGRTFQSAGFVMLALQSIMLPSWGLYRCLNWRPVASLGVLSYSIYVWQNIFCAKPAKFGLTDPWWMTYPLWLVPAFAAAILSYHFLEKPFFNLRHRFR
jgi:peptidoglycan/LPS O-acetylase OafA/YrhL